MAKKRKLYGTRYLSILYQRDSLVPTRAIPVIASNEVKNAMVLAIQKDFPCLLVGETGIAKTSIVREVAALRKQSYVRVNMTGFTTPDELIGTKSIKNDETYFEYGIVTDAMRRGAILVLDEINATTPDCLFILHGLLDEDRRITLPNGETITPHPDFRVFATCNPDYEGTRSMNKAFLDRFPIILDIQHLNQKDEVKLLEQRTGVSNQVALDLVETASLARKEYFNQKLSVFISTRTLLNAAHLVGDGFPVEDAFKLTIMRKTQNTAEQKLLLDFYYSVIKSAPVRKEDEEITVNKREYDLLKKKIEEMENEKRFVMSPGFYAPTVSSSFKAVGAVGVDGSETSLDKVRFDALVDEYTSVKKIKK